MTNDGTQGDVVLDRLNHRSQKTLFLRNGVDKKLFSSPTDTIDNPNFDSDGPVLLTVSRLVSWKRVDRAIQALPKVVKRYPETTLVIVGDGPEQSSLEEQARSLNVRENIHFAGAVPHDQIPQYLNSSDIFLSLFDISNVGNPLLEALTAGCCIVTLDTGATATVITDGENGKLLSLSDINNLSNVIIELISDDDKRSMLARNASDFADKQLWTWEERIDREIEEVSGLVN
jgi:glycosyltransferase involved in cell wall biosynthesis